MIFFINCWNLVWLLDSGAEEVSKCFTFSVFAGVKIYHSASAAPLAMYVINPCLRALIHLYVTQYLVGPIVGQSLCRSPKKRKCGIFLDSPSFFLSFLCMWLQNRPETDIIDLPS